MAQAGSAIIDLAVSLSGMEHGSALAYKMAVADLIGKLCRTLRISNINCVSNCCNEQRSNSPDPRESVPVAVQTEQSGRDRQTLEGGKETDSGNKEEGIKGISSDTVRVHAAQTSSKEVQKKKSYFSKH